MYIPVDLGFLRRLHLHSRALYQTHYGKRERSGKQYGGYGERVSQVQHPVTAAQYETLSEYQSYG
jgi:hypothetical protein